MSSNDFFKMKNIVKQYVVGEEVQTILKGIDLEIREGEFLSILGPSGSGKSTLMNIIGCLDTPTSGEYILHGRTIRDLDEKQLAHIRSKEIGFIFQQFQLLPRLDALKNVELPLIYAGVSPKERTERAQEMLVRVGLKDRMHHYQNQLSGGQQQRVAIARALATNPTLLLADEPTGALDQATGEQVMQLFRELNDEGRTIIMITHDLGVIAGMCSRVLVMYGGVVVEEGTVREIFYEPKHPYTWGLLRSIPQKSGEKRKLIPIPGSPPDLIAPPPGCPFVARCPYAMNICNSALPEMTRLSQTHCARCRLLDEGAPRIVWEGNRE